MLDVDRLFMVAIILILIFLVFLVERIMKKSVVTLINVTIILRKQLKHIISLLE